MALYVRPDRQVVTGDEHQILSHDRHRRGSATNDGPSYGLADEGTGGSAGGPKSDTPA